MRGDEISIPKPCSQDWESMIPGQNGRYCQHCAYSVADLSAMSEQGARDYLEAQKGQRHCVSMLVRGTEIVHAPAVPASVLVRRAPRGTLTRFAPSALAGVLALFGLAACTTPAEADVFEDPEEEVLSSKPETAAVIPQAPEHAVPTGDTPCEVIIKEPEVEPFAHKKGRTKRIQGDRVAGPAEERLLGEGV